jgi:hypothetical protein
LLPPHFSGENIVAVTVFDHGAVDTTAFIPGGWRRTSWASMISATFADQVVDLVGVEHRHVAGIPSFKARG